MMKCSIRCCIIDHYYFNVLFAARRHKYDTRVQSNSRQSQAHISRLQQLITELPCVDETEDTPKTTPLGRTRSDSISSNVSTLSIMSTTRDEMLEIIGRLRLKTDVGKKPVAGPMYAGGRGPIKDF